VRCRNAGVWDNKICKTPDDVACSIILFNIFYNKRIYIYIRRLQQQDYIKVLERRPNYTKVLRLKKNKSGAIHGVEDDGAAGGGP
jgi:hypothetical protein